MRAVAHLAVPPRQGLGIDCDIAAHLLAQDVIYVRGGSVVSLLGMWRAHGLDEVLRACWHGGTVLCSLSAGSLCWFAEAITAFHGQPQRIDGLGLLPWSNCVHYDREPGRRAAYLEAVRDGIAPGYAGDDGAALHFVGSELAGVVASHPGAGAYRVDTADGAARETPLPVVCLADARGLVAV